MESTDKAQMDLLAAAEVGDLDAVSDAIKRGADPSRHFGLPYHLCARHNQPDVYFLLKSKCGISPEITNEVFLDSASYGCAEIMSDCISAATDVTKELALMRAVKSRHEDCIDMLMKNNAPLDILLGERLGQMGYSTFVSKYSDRIDKTTAFNALTHAISSKKTDTALLLVPLADCRMHRSLPLTMAINTRNIEVAKALIPVSDVHLVQDDFSLEDSDSTEESLQIIDLLTEEVSLRQKASGSNPKKRNTGI